MRLQKENKLSIICALGTSQTIAWASSYYLPAVLATPTGQDINISSVLYYSAFSAALVISAIIGPWAGKRIDRLGGRGILIISNLIFAAGLCLLSASDEIFMLFSAWSLLGVGMGIGLYDSAFATLASIHKFEARTSITGITLIAGFASTLGWPLSSLMETHLGWRGACLGWVALHLCIALPLNAILPSASNFQTKTTRCGASHSVGTSDTQFLQLALLGYVFAVTWFTSTAMAVHLPRLLEMSGATSIAAVAAGAMIGPAQVCARILEVALLRNVSPLTSTRLAALAHPVGAGILGLVGGPAVMIFAILHGAGNGIMTIAKGTLPLTIFGPVGYGLRQGIISLPARSLQSLAPLIFGFLLEIYGKNAILITATMGLSAFLALIILRVRATDSP